MINLLQIPFIGWVLIIFLLITRDWKQMLIYDTNKGLHGGFKEAIFDNMDDAKKLIDQELQKENDRMYEKYKNEIKKNYKVKYP